MLPITPHNYSTSSYGYSRTVRGYKQARPYNLTTPVSIETMRALYGDETHMTIGYRSWGWTINDTGKAGDPNVVQRSVNQAYERLVAKLGDASSFGSTLSVERKDTLNLITGTVIRLASAARSVRKLDFRSAAATLGLPYLERTVKYKVKTRRGPKGRVVYRRKRVMRLPTGREVAKTSANGWLLWSYGASPLIDDIKNGVDFLTREDPPCYVSGTGAAESQRVESDSNSWWAASQGYSVYTYKARAKTRIRCAVAVDNYNLWLANRLGLVNPVQMVNEGIPFSFVVDWFSNLSEVINSLTDFVGLRVTDAWTSTLFRQEQHFVYIMPYTGYPRGDQSGKVRDVYRREAGMRTPKLLFAYERFEIRRAVNAISLLVGFLPRK